MSGVVERSGASLWIHLEYRMFFAPTEEFCILKVGGVLMVDSQWTFGTSYDMMNDINSKLEKIKEMTEW
jgi:hypothetical protein